MYEKYFLPNKTFESKEQCLIVRKQERGEVFVGCKHITALFQSILHLFQKKDRPSALVELGSPNLPLKCYDFDVRFPPTGTRTEFLLSSP